MVGSVIFIFGYGGGHRGAFHYSNQPCYTENWEQQGRSRSWFLTIREQRRAIRRHLRQNSSLKSRLAEVLEEGFEAGVDLALRETNLPIRAFPEVCPYALDAILQDNFLCDTSGDWE